MAQVTELELVWAESIVEKHSIESSIEKAQQEIAALESGDVKIPELEDKLKNHRLALHNITTKIEANRAEYKNNISSNSPLKSIKSEEQPQIHLTHDLFSNNPVVSNIHVEDSSISTPAHHTGRLP